MLSFGLVLAAVLGSVAVLLYQGIAIVLAYSIPALDPAPSDRRPAGRVSVVIAARNEAQDLPATLTGLLSQDYPDLEIVVVDGGSTDGTRSVVESFGPRVRYVPEPPLPSGWVGKNWACSVGARATNGPWVLFMDADVRLAPAAVRTVLDWAEREDADLATISPRLEMVGFWEKLVLPFFVQMVLTYFRAPRMNRAGSRAAMANGQFLLVRRDVYDSLGGHAGIREFVLEDVALARRFRSAGRTLRLAHAVELASTRMYRDRHELFEGLLKNIHGSEFSAVRQVGFLAGLVGFFWLPLAVLPVGLLYGSPVLVGVGAFLDLALFAKHVGFARGVGAPAAYGLLYPVAVGFYFTLIATSLVHGLAGRPVEWKGRAYPRLSKAHTNR